MFSIRAVILDHYMCDPISELYVGEPSSDLNQFQEPVLRIFGSNIDGFKSCVHVHGVYPYVYVPYKGGENPDRDCLLVGAALDEALAKANDNGKNCRYVFKVIPVSKIPLYGYHSKHRQFFQIFFCNPYHIRKAMELLMSGAILGQKFQPYEAHIPYALQFMIDYNIYGMSFVTFSKVKYRKNPENSGSLVSVNTEDIFSNKVKKITCCYFEVDALAQDILNKNNKNVMSANPGLEAIWQEEKIRRRNHNKPSQVSISSSASRVHVEMCASEVMYKEELAKKLREISFEKPEIAVSTTEPGFLYPAETPEISTLPEGSVSSKDMESTKAENRVSEMIDEHILSQLVFSRKESRDSESEDEGREGRIEADSILGRNHNEEEEAEFEDDDGGDMTQPLDIEENMMCESDANRGEQGQSSAGSEDNFWKIMADRIFQLDGAQDSSSESDPEAAYRTLPRLSNSHVSVDTMLACCSPDNESMSNWSNNIMSILTEDNSCISPTISPSPQTVWSNYSTKMDSSWLYDNSREPWTWNKNETVFEDCFSLKQKPDICDFAVGTAEELSKKRSPNEALGNLFESDQVDFSENPFENIGSIYPMSPLPSVVNSSANAENNSESSVHYSSKRVSDTLKSSSPSDEKMNTTTSKNVEKKMKTVGVRRKDVKSDKMNQDKFLDVLDKFSSVSRKEEEDEIRKRKPLTLKQYIRDCEEIVNIDFKNLSDREMVIIEYKPLNGRSTENKFIIKPLDKFLKNWNSAEKKVTNGLVNSEKPEDCRPKSGNKMKEGCLVTSKSSKEKNNLCGLVNSFEHKYGGDWLEPIKINSIKNKLVELSPNNDEEKTYKVNENVISQGKIKMKLTKSTEKDLIKKCAYREKPSNYVKCNKFRHANSDVNANHISMFTYRSNLDRESNQVKKSGETFRKGEKMNSIELEEVRRKEKKKEVIKRKGADVGDRLPKKLRKSQSQRAINLTDSDSKIINKINSCFEKYYKNIVKVNNFHNENDNNYYFEDSEEDLEDDTKKFINSMMDKQAENDLNYSNSDPVKFVTKLLSSFSHMSQSSEIPPLSITISLGNVSNTSTTPITPIPPIQLNLQPTVNVPTKFVKYRNKKHKRKMSFQNVDGPADSSSEDSGDSKSEGCSLKTTKRDGFYKPLKLISHNSEFVKSGKKRKISRFTNKKDSESLRKTSSSLEVCSVNFSKNSKFSSTLDEKSSKKDPTFQEKRELPRDLRKVKRWPAATKNRGTHLSQNSSDSEAEPDFIYDSDKESHSKQKNEKATSKISKNYSGRIPQADVCLSSSEEEEVEIQNLVHVKSSTDPVTIVKGSQTKRQTSEGMDILDSNQFELGKLSTERIASWQPEDVASSSKIREDAKDASSSNSEALSGMLVSSLCQFSSKSLESSNDVITHKNQKVFTSEKFVPSELSLPSEKWENSWKTRQKVFFKTTKVIPALPQTETNNLIKDTNRTSHPSSVVVDRNFYLSSENIAIVSSATGSQVTLVSSDDKPMTESLGQSTHGVLSSKDSSGLSLVASGEQESNSLKRPVNSKNSIFSQSSCMSSSEASNASFFNSPSVTSIRGTKVVAPRRKPPKGNAVLSILHETDLLPNWNEVPFYSDSRDRFRVMETGPKILKIESSSIVELKTFKSSLNLLGTEERRENILNYQMQGCRGTRHLFVTDISIKIIPLRKPPTSSNVIKWLHFKNKEKNLDNKVESGKIKIVVPLSPDNGSELEEEMDLSMTLNVLDKTNSSINLISSENCSRSSSNDCPVFPGSGNLDSKSLARGAGEEPKVDLKKGPLSKIKGMKRLLQANFKKSDSEENSLIGVEKTSEITFSKNSKESSEHSFQIKGVTCNNTFGFDGSVENMQDIKLGQTHQNMSMLVIEVHVLSRKDLRPDPRHDPIRALFYTANFDDSEQKQETGIIVVGNKGISTEIGIGVKTVHHVPTESELIRRTVELTRAWDPDILAGYEIEMNSWGYLIQRSFVLDKNLLYMLGRVQTGQSESASSKYTADFLGEPDEYYETPRNVRQMKISGRIVLDVWRVLRHEIALTSYTFENVMYHLSHERHPVFSHETLSFYWEHQSHRLRHITVEYYLTRVLGVVKLLDQLDFINRTSELSRLFGIQFYEVLSRGSQFRVESMMLRLAKPLDYIPVSPSVAQRAAMRAPASLPLILEPESKFYADPVIVLDFQSLYPSMIIAYNYCFSTCLGRVENLGSREPFEFGCTQLQISPEELKLLENDITISPAGVAFVKSTIRRGVLPVMLEEILETRLMVKKSMKENKGQKTLEKLLFARQLGLKLIANVTYGYTAANFSGRMPCIEVGDSVVSKGRETLHRTIQLVKNTPKWGAKVVYGDTDSIFVLTPGKSRQEAFQIGAEIAEIVTQSNPKPVKLKLEKVYQPSILQTKKRYVGYMYESPEQSKPIFEAKGIETVRRDGCPAVGKILQKALQILFDTRDVSLVKKYTTRQFGKLFQGRVNIQDLIFAKEYRGRKGYRPGACVPALQLAKEWTERDKRAEPRVKERVPYVIVNGPPGVPLIQCVRSPGDLISDPSLTISPVYYITKAIIPPMQRCFSLMGVDVMSWYLEMPRKYHKSYKVNLAEGQRRSTISQYFSTAECIVCSEVTNTQICQECHKQPQILAVSLTEKIRRWERCYANTLRICQSCCGRPTELECQSLDCPVFFRRNRVSRDLDQALFLREVLHHYL